MKNRPLTRVVRFFRALYLKLFRINDSPQRIAFGIGLGVFFGVLPGLGPLAALFFAFIVKANRAAALLGSVLTNTWLSIPVFFLSVKTGAVITGTRYADIPGAWTVLMKNFTWHSLFELSAYDILIPVMLGYLLVSFAIGMCAYAATFGIVAARKRRRS